MEHKPALFPRTYSYIYLLGLCWHQSSHSHYTRSNSGGFEIQINQMGSPLWVLSFMNVTYEHGNRMVLCHWDVFIDADVAMPRSQSPIGSFSYDSH